MNKLTEQQLNHLIIAVSLSGALGFGLWIGIAYESLFRGILSVIIFYFIIALVMAMIVFKDSKADKDAEASRRERAIAEYNFIISNATVVLSSTNGVNSSLGYPEDMVAFYDNANLIVFYDIRKIKTEIEYSNIRSVEVVVDNNVAYEKSGIGRAVVGGILAGGAGAVVGAVTGKTTKQENVKSVAVVVRLKELARPSFTFSLYTETPGTAKASRATMSAQAIDLAARIADTIGVILDRDPK